MKLEMPWKNLKSSFDVTGVSNVREAMEKADMNWEVEKSQSYDLILKEEGDNLVQDFVPVKNVYNIRRKDNHYVMGQTGKSWMPLQNSEAFDFFQPFIDEGMFELERVGHFNGGGKTFMVAKSTSEGVDITGKGDFLINYIYLTNGHDGKTGVSAVFSPIRLFCSNQLPGLMNGAFSGAVNKIRHSRLTSDIVGNIRDALMYDIKNESQYFDGFRKMASTTINGAKLNEYVQKFLKIKDLDEAKTRGKNIFDRVVSLAISGAGNTGETAWDFFNGCTQFLNHEKGNSQENRFKNLIGGAELKRAYNLALELAA